MLSTNTSVLDYFKQQTREVEAEIEIGTLSLVPSGDLVSFSIERSAPNGKFFGYSVAQMITIEALGEQNVSKYDEIYVYAGEKDGPKATLPTFYVDTVVHNATNNTTTITGYDIIGSHPEVFKDTAITYPISLYNFAVKVVSEIGGTISADFTGVNPTIAKNTLNLDGSETYRTVLTAIAEATGTICYCSTGTTVVFRTLDKGTTANDSFDGSNYFDFSTDAAVTLTKIASATELGDNVEVGTDGYTQTIRDNPFLVLRSDLASLLNAIYEKVKNIQITPHTLNFRGNPYYEIGDLLAIDTVKDETKYIHYLNSTFTYNGGFGDSVSWESGTSEDIEAAPTSLGDALNKTYAKVDKVNKQIQLVVSDVEQMEGDIGTLSQQVSQTMTKEDVKIEINKTLSQTGVNAVTTTTGFTFNAEGLLVEKSGSDLTTQITEDGMTVFRKDAAVLTANNTGVEAINLHANTYLIIGANSRFEDYDNSQRTGCFWIGN